MEGIHVLHVLNSAHGGSAISTLELIEALKVRGVKSSLVCFNNADEHQRKTLSDLVEGRVLFIPLYWMNKRIRVAWWKRPLLEMLTAIRTWWGYRYQAKISALIQREGVTVVHTSTILNPEGAIAAKRHNLPHVWHVRELIGPDKHYQFYNQKSWARYVSTHCRILVANSTITAACLGRYFDKAKIVTIVNGIDVKKFQVKSHVPDKHPLIVGMVGSVTSRWKNHAHFIRTAVAFKNDSAITFRIYGSLPEQNDPYLAGLSKLIRELDCESIVTFVPFARPDEIMREIDVLFHPTNLESFGRIFIEAMAGGIPVIGIVGGGGEEMIREGVNGFLVPPEDVDMAATRIQQLLASAQLRSAFGAAGRQLVEQRYTLDYLAESMQNLYFRYSIKSV